MIAPLIALAVLRQEIPEVWRAENSARGVLDRTIGIRSNDFRLSLIYPHSGKDSFQVEAKNGIVVIRGTSGVALCRGAYEYLKEKCNSFVSWEGSNINLPKRLPDASIKGACPVQYRHYYNICTFGYTTAFWDWPRWQREIDWMALHGINMPLALTGQDKVWQRVFSSYGVRQSSLDKFFSGPAFQPWHWMGNLNGHGGPTPQSWLNGQAELQKKILASERALGMRPVVPGFSGFVPTDFAKYQPNVKLQSPTAWAGFEPTTFVDIRDPMFVDIGRRFVQEYRKEFGTDHLYLCDTFNEQNPQFPDATKLQDLANAGRSVYEGLKQADPDAVWVMQGWLFYNERDYWHEPEIEALLSKVPDGKMIILDLSGEQYAVFAHSPAVAKKGFIYCTLHNFGQNTGLGGDLQGYVTKEIDAHRAVDRMMPGTLILGFGLTPEGIDQNPVVYELMTDSMWIPARPYVVPPGMPSIDVSHWIEEYVRARYGGDLTNVQAWRHLLSGIYSKDAPWFRDAWRGRPGRGRRGRPLRQMRDIERALDLMLVSVKSPALRANPLFQRDLVDVCKTWLGGIADRQVLLAMQTWKDKPSEYALHKVDFFKTLDEIDQVMACRPEHRLSTWIARARSWGKTPSEKRLIERNARLQITAWDEKGVLTDYANKEWAGLTKDFVARRWRAYFEGLETKTQPDYHKIEMDWVNSTTPPEESRPGDAVATVREVFARHHGEVENLEEALGSSEPPGNLAKNGEATDDGHTEPGGTPANAIDGDMETYWAASPSPCTWTLDLKAPKMLKTIDVFPYWGDGRSYQYVVEASADGQDWRQIVDMSHNTESSSMSGHRHVLPSAVAARYVRVKMLKNSANVGVHLVEVRIYDH